MQNTNPHEYLVLFTLRLIITVSHRILGGATAVLGSIYPFIRIVKVLRETIFRGTILIVVRSASIYSYREYNWYPPSCYLRTPIIESSYRIGTAVLKLLLPGGGTYFEVPEGTC